MAFKTDVEAVVLALLQHESLHGYEITKRMREMDVASMAESQLYPVLHKLELASLIESVWIPQEGKPARKVYSITASGARELDGKRKEWTRFSLAIGGLLAKEGGRG